MPDSPDMTGAPPPMGQLGGGDGHWVTINGAHVYIGGDGSMNIGEKGIASYGYGQKGIDRSVADGIARSVAKELGFPIERIEVTSATSYSTLGKYIPRDRPGHTDNGFLYLYHKTAFSEDGFAGTTRHEINHAMADDLKQQFDEEWAKLETPEHFFDYFDDQGNFTSTLAKLEKEFPTIAFMQNYIGVTPSLPSPNAAEMIRDDGFSKYSRSYWPKYTRLANKYGANSEEAHAQLDLTWIETTAEIAKWRHAGPELRAYQEATTPSKRWLDFTKEMEKRWKALPDRHKKWWQ